MQILNLYLWAILEIFKYYQYLERYKKYLKGRKYLKKLLYELFISYGNINQLQINILIIKYL